MISMDTAGGTTLLNANELLRDELGVFPGGIIADLGCGGAGYFVITAAKIVGSEGKVYAVDVQVSVLDNIQSRADIEHLTNIETVWSNLEVFGATKINNDVLDYATLVNILFQNSNKLGILKEASRLLKSGGKLLVIDWEEGRFNMGPRHAMKVPKDEVVGLAKQAGLRLEKQFAAGVWHYGLLFVK